MISINEFKNRRKSFSADVAIIVPGQCTYNEMLSLNFELQQQGKPYILFYYNGAYLSIGPFIIPKKTACLGCQIHHQLQKINIINYGGERLVLDDIKELNFSVEIPTTFNESQLAYFSTLICEDSLNILLNESVENLHTKRLYKENSYTMDESQVYFPRTDCESCQAMNNSYRKLDGANLSLVHQTKPSIEEDIIYTIGGLRSKSENETKKIIDETLVRIGLNIEIKRAKKNPFNEIVPCYEANITTSLSNKTLYFFRETFSLGKGMTVNQSYFSVAFEMFEHISRQYVGEIPIINASFLEVEEQAINMSAIKDSIRNNFTNYEPFNPSMKVDWFWAKSLITHRNILVPASMVFMDDVVTNGRFYGGSSTGLASATTIDDATLHALLEVIEHDGWMIGQSNQIVLPKVDYMTSNNMELKERIKRIKQMEFEVVCRDYTNDLDIPVFRTWIVNPTNYTHFAYSGLGASISPEIALERSITEAMQSNAIVNPNNPLNSNLSGEKLLSRINSIYSLSYLYRKDVLGESKKISLFDKPNPKVKSVSEAVKLLLHKLKEKMPECDVLFVDLTKEIINIPTVRVIVTGEIQRFNIPLISVSPRTFKFGVNMGYSKTPSQYSDLYLGDFPH